MKSVLIRPTTGARRATRRTALAAALLLASSTLAASVPQQADATTSCLDGAGTVGDPFLVATEADLRKVGSGVDGCTLSAHYLQTQNITLNETFTSIGRDPSNLGSQASFTGVYDGGGKSISGMEIVEATRRSVGFVAQTSSSAKLMNIVLVNPKIQGSDRVGGLVGENDGEIRDVIVIGGTVQADYIVGGLVGWNKSSISDSRFSGGVVSNVDDDYSGAGGLVGINYGAITNSSTAGYVEGGDWVGGMVGDSSGGSIIASFSTSDVDGRNKVGGLIGEHYNSGTITNAYATGNVSGANRVGGLVGEIAAGMTNVFSVGRVEGDENVGGLIGDEDDDELDIIAAFWDVGTSLIGASGDDNFGATGRTTAEMTSFATFDDSVELGVDDGDRRGLAGAEQPDVGDLPGGERRVPVPAVAVRLGPVLHDGHHDDGRVDPGADRWRRPSGACRAGRVAAGRRHVDATRRFEPCHEPAPLRGRRGARDPHRHCRIESRARARRRSRR
jgi:hypothetical protein